MKEIQYVGKVGKKIARSEETNANNKERRGKGCFFAFFRFSGFWGSEVCIGRVDELPGKPYQRNPNPNPS